MSSYPFNFFNYESNLFQNYKKDIPNYFIVGIKLFLIELIRAFLIKSSNLYFIPLKYFPTCAFGFMKRCEKMGISKGFTLDEMIYHLDSLNQFYSRASVGIQIYNRKGNIKYSNRYSLEIFGIETIQELNKIDFFKEIGISSSKKKTLFQDSKIINDSIILDIDYIKDKKKFKSIKTGKLFIDVTIKPMAFQESENLFYFVHLIDVTERKKFERELKDNEVRFRNIVENSMEGIFIVDDDYKMVYANQELSKILGYPLNEIIGSDFRKFLDKESLDFVVERYKRRQRGERVVPRYEFNIIKKSGEKRRLEMVSTATRELIGGVKTIAQVLDITEQKRIIVKLKESEEKFKNLAEQSLISILIIQNDEIKYANKNFGKDLGYSDEEIRNWSLEEVINIVHPDDRQFTYDRTKTNLKEQDGKVQNYEVRIIKKNGEIAWREIFSKKISFEGKIADLITSVDITDKKKSEEKLKESEEKFRGIFEAIPDIFFLITPDSTIIDYKGKREELFLPPETFMNKRMIDLFPESISKQLSLKIQNTISQKTPQIMEYKLKIHNEIRYFEARILYYSAKRLAIFTREITKRKLADKMIKEEVKRLREIDKIRRDLVSRVSHELKTPIMAISGATELIKIYQHDLSKEAMDLVKMIESNEKRLNHLINNLLDISRADYDQITLNKRKIDICKLIRDIVNEMKILKDQRKISLKLELPDSAFLTLDQLRMEQVLINLLSNAIKNTPPNGEIKINLMQKNGWIEIIVQDTGVGFTQDEMKQLFTKFGKIERYGKGLEYLDIRGSGLGLFISNEIVKLHGGSIKVYSEGRNKDYIFRINLPRRVKI
ncbi:MAG: PAS domain-containing sensor histidine kinase [Promethearchaeota archaeon]|nr:MAG: PAS domain-containing sensor histidine kinase [Candidatus Lokiarchaeota archaeon]